MPNDEYESKLDKYSDDAFDPSERQRIRLATECVLGNGRRGLTARVSWLERLGWLIVAALAGLWIEGRLHVTVQTPPDAVGVVAGD